MHILIAALLVAAATQPKVSVSLVSPVNPALTQRRDAIAAVLSPSAKLKLHGLARSASITAGSSRSAIVSAFPGVNLSDSDVSALAFIVMMDAAESARQDLQSIMQGVSAINAQKDALRKELGKANATKVRVQKVYTPVNTALTVPPPLSANATMAEKEKRLDDLGDLSEEQQSRMRMAMEQMQKAESIASNMLKKMGDMQSSIIRNLK